METLRTSILCGHERHTITIGPDGATSSGCTDVSEEAGRLAAVARLRKKQLSTSGCVPFVALAMHGVPYLFGRQVFEDGMRMGAWKALYNRYRNNKAIVSIADGTRRARDAAHSEALRLARIAIRKTAYRPHWENADLDENTSFLCNQTIEEGQMVACGEHDHWNVPLQKGWLDDVAKNGIAVVSSKLVVGRDPDDPYSVFAIGIDPKTEFWVVRRYSLVTKPKLALRAPGRRA
jgi:hypothetical protein